MAKKAMAKTKAPNPTKVGPKSCAKVAPAEPKPGEAPSASTQPAPPTELEVMTKERDELEDRLAYMQAEFENLKRRNQRDIEARLFRAKESLFLDVLCVMDNMDRALIQLNGSTGKPSAELEDFAKGVRMIHQQMRQVLTQHGLEPIEALGQPFDPFRHDALMKVEVPDEPDGIVLEELVKGYTLDGNILRPTKVKVNILPKAKAEKKETEKQSQ